MNQVKILDCTLRDGGYVNDWRFGDEVAVDIVKTLGGTGVDYSELGFIRLGDYESGRIQFSEMDQVSRLFRPSAQKLAIMVEIGYGYPVTKFPKRTAETADMVRVVVWKRMQKEGVEYCKRLKDLGYEVSVQATRSDQYNLEELAEFVTRFSEADPDALYIVDTFGLLTKGSLLDYLSVVDANLKPGALLGYHAHNNLQQAFANAVAAVERPWRHTLMLDASVAGIGRGAGNLGLELLFKYLNETQGGSYNEAAVWSLMDGYLGWLQKERPWGYSLPYLLSARNGVNPNYVAYVEARGLSIREMSAVFAAMHARGAGIVFEPKFCDEIIAEVKA